MLVHRDIPQDRRWFKESLLPTFRAMYVGAFAGLIPLLY